MSLHHSEPEISTVRHFRHVSSFLFKNLDINEKRKRFLVLFSSLLAIPTLLFFTVQDIRVHDTLGIYMDGGLALLFIVCIAILSKVRNGIWIYRIVLLGLSVVLLYNAITGPSGESSVLWLYIYPLTSFYILGIYEGFLLFAVTFLISCASIFFPAQLHSYAYPMDLRIRFLISMSIVTILSFSLEFLRNYFYTQLESQREQLKKALDKVRTLDGLVPICSMCKKIRDDRGYWNNLERYLVQHTNATLSHGICDGCLKEEYPEIYAKKYENKPLGSNYKTVDNHLDT